MSQAILPTETLIVKDLKQSIVEVSSPEFPESFNKVTIPVFHYHAAYDLFMERANIDIASIEDECLKSPLSGTKIHSERNLKGILKKEEDCKYLRTPKSCDQLRSKKKISFKDLIIIKYPVEYESTADD